MRGKHILLPLLVIWLLTPPTPAFLQSAPFSCENLFKELTENFPPNTKQPDKDRQIAWLFTETYIPFEDPRRRSLKSIKKRFESEFGAYRASFIKGHKHSGLDLRGGQNERVYPIGKGWVCDIHLSFPHLTLVILHQRPDGKIFYSSYKHIEDILVRPGDRVDETTALARLFDSRELKKSGFGVNHLHFEIRKNFDDGGKASWMSMSREVLLHFFEDPYLFFKSRLKP